jgi:hypothetical protein
MTLQAQLYRTQVKERQNASAVTPVSPFLRERYSQNPNIICRHGAVILRLRVRPVGFQPRHDQPFPGSLLGSGAKMHNHPYPFSTVRFAPGSCPTLTTPSPMHIRGPPQEEVRQAQDSGAEPGERRGRKCAQNPSLACFLFSFSLPCFIASSQIVVPRPSIRRRGTSANPQMINK